MGFFSKFEGRMEDTLEGVADKMFDAPISPVQIAKKAERAMRREKMVGAGKQYAPTLFTVLVNPDDDQRLLGYYPTLAGETETYLAAKAADEGLVMDGQPLVRFIVDDSLRHGKFDIVAEPVAAPIIRQLRAEEMQRYGIGGNVVPGYQPPAYPAPNPYGQQSAGEPYGAYGGYGEKPVLPSVPEEEIDYSIDYGEYTFDSQNFNDSREPAPFPPAAPYGAHAPAPAASGIPNTVVFAAGGGSAAPQPAAHLIRARLINLTGNITYDLATARLIIGREQGNDIVVDDINASRTHAELRFEPQGAWVISDLGSTNGTFVNGQEVSSQVLYEGDRITIGMTAYEFSQM